MARNNQISHDTLEDIEGRIAILIDGDNAQATLIEEILVEAGKYGSATIRRVYGDWTTPNMNSWKDTLNIHAFQPIQQFRYTVGKNATDSAMIIDAMDILHMHQVDGFCLVSSDSDYTRLATRIRGKRPAGGGDWSKKHRAGLRQRLQRFHLYGNLRRRSRNGNNGKDKTNHMSAQERD